ncbi:MAG: NAD(P)H-dependent oxidoreductase, partial [Brevinematales bacterium]
KGDLSVTLQYVRLLQKQMPDFELQEFNTAQQIKIIEQNPSLFDEILSAVRDSDIVLWAFPLYYLLVHSSYKRFIELLFEGAGEAFRGKYAAAISTSIHFYDHTAHNYIRGISEDLGMKFYGSFSAEMNDIFKKENRRQLLQFGNGLLETVKAGLEMPRYYEKVPVKMNALKLEKPQGSIEDTVKKVLVLTDASCEDSNIREMTDYFMGLYKTKPELINLRDIDIKGGCLGCIQCGFDNVCVYEGKDGYIDFFRNKVMKADILIFAGTVRDRYLSSLWKMFFDRTFFLTHQPVHSGQQAGFIISGPLGRLENLREILEGYIENNEGNLIGFVTDECRDAAQTAKNLTAFARTAAIFSENNYRKPQTFMGLGGRLIFRDAIFGQLRFIFSGDHRYYKKHGWYDYPHYNAPQRLANLFLPLLKLIPGFKKAFRPMIKKEMVVPYRKAALRADSRK